MVSPPDPHERVAPVEPREAASNAAVELIQPGMTIGLGSGRAVWAVTERQLDGTFELDLAIDGADEIDPSLGLIKGGGGALLREKIVISAAKRFVVVAEAKKKVARLGEGFRLPVEVVRFGWADTGRRLSALLPDAELRGTEGGGPDPYVTDESHYIL